MARPGPARRRRLAWSFVLVLVPVALTQTLLTPGFETNDDAWMMLSLSGRVTSDSPTGYVIFLNLILGSAVASLYRLAPEVPWYAWTHLGVIFLALWAVAHELLRGEVVPRLLLFAVGFGVFWLPLLTGFQFTRTSFLAGACGILVADRILSRGLAAGRLARGSAAGLAAAGVLITIAVLMRPESLALAAILSLPLIGFSLWRAGQAGRARAYAAAAVGTTALVTLLHYGSDMAYQRRPEWTDYLEFNDLASLFTDFGGIRDRPELDRALAEVGWSENDYRMLMHWFYVDPVTYSAERVRRAGGYVDRARSAGEVGAALARVGGRLASDPVALAGALGLLAFLVWRSPRELLVLEAITLMVALALLVFLTAFLKLPPWIYECILMYPLLLALVFAPGGGAPAARPRRATLRRAVAWALFAAAAGVAAAPAAGPIQRAVRSSAQRVEVNLEMKQALAELRPRPSQTFVVWGSAFPFEAILPWEGKDYLEDFRVVGAGASSQSPIQTRMLARQGIDDLHRALYRGDEVYLVIAPDPLYRELLATYTREHYGVEVTFEPVRQLYRAEVVRMVESPAP